MVLNVSEMEAKVREATNDDPWYVHIISPMSFPNLCDLLFITLQGCKLNIDARDCARVSLR